MNRKMLSSSQTHSRAIPYRGFTLAAFVLALAAAALADDSTTKPTVALGMAVPPQLAQATYLGKPSASAKMTLSISLAPADYAGLQSYADAVADRQSPNYRKYLSPKQVGDRFGATAATINTTVSFLKGKGMTIKLIADNHLAILFSGTVAQTEAAFATKIGNYRGPDPTGSSTREFFSYQSVPKAPSAIAKKIVSVGGLQNYFLPLKHSTLTPSQTRVLYNVASLYDTSGFNHKGEGINIGISNYDGYRLSNLPLLYSSFGLAIPTGGVGANVTKVSVDGTDGETQFAQGEGDLDIELALAMAPKCHLIIYDAQDPVALLTRMSQDNAVDIASESYGWFTSEATRTFIAGQHNQHLALSAQGITYMHATGDTGTDLGGYDYPGFDPEVLQIGGTVATVDATGNRITEDGWNGSGGGWTNFNIDFNNTLPVWQHGTTVPSNIQHRIYPDFSLHAAGANGGIEEFQAYDYVYNGVLDKVSGTSASSPTFAGQLGLILQELVASGGLEVDPSSNRPRLGPIQKDYVYTLWDGRSDIFNDVLTGNTGTLLDGTQSVGKAGWDYVTGYGAPNALGMLNALTEDFVPPLTTMASDAEIFTSTAPTITFGTSPIGDTDSLATTDGIAYSVLSIKQNGVGQVAAATLDFNLQSTTENRRSVSLQLAVQSERLTTEYVYFLNPSTNKYDVVKTLPATGAMGTVGVTVASKYIGDDNTIHALVRSLKATRLGSSPFRLTVDQATLVERVSTSG